MIKNIWILALLITSASSAQNKIDTVYLNSQGEVTDSSDAFCTKITYYNNIYRDSSGRIDLYKKGVLYKSTSYSNIGNHSQEGLALTYFPNGSVKYRENFRNNKRDGLQETFYEDGRERRRDSFAAGEYVEGTILGPDGRYMAHFPLQVEAEYLRGNEKIYSDIANNFDYTKNMRQNGMEGRTIIQFIVESSGNIKDVKVFRSSGHDEIDEQSIKAVQKLGKFIPAKFDGEDVDSYFTIPIRAVLN